MFVFALLLIPLLVKAAAASAGGVETAPPPARTALVVAIGDYPDELAARFADLPGPGNDAPLVHDLLVGRFGFAPEEIRVLQDAAATHEAIVRAFHDWLIARAGPDTEVVFWYSGHGSRVPDRSGVARAERGGMDSTLLAWDSRGEGRDGEYDVTDDELASLLRALTLRTSRITVVTDACHSAGVLRGPGAPRARAAPAGARPFEFERVRAFWPAGVPFLDDDAGQRAAADRYVHVSACAPDQLAFEWHLGNEAGTAYGALTLFLAHRLQEAQPGETYRQIVDTVARWIATKLPGQSVQREGALDRVLFSGQFVARPPGFAAHLADGSRNMLSVGAGSLHGLCRGSRLKVRDLHGNEIGAAEVTEARAVSAAALWKGPVPQGLGVLPLVVTEESRPAGHEPLTVHVDHASVAGLLASRADVRLVASPDSYTHRLMVDPPDAGVTDPARVRFLAPDGTRIWPGPSEDMTDEDWLARLETALPEVLRRERRYLDVMALAEAPGSLRLAASFVPLEPQDLEGRDSGRDGFAAWAYPLVDARVVPHGGAAAAEFRARLDPAPGLRHLARLDVVNAEEREMHVTVLSATEARDVHVVWPLEGTEFVLAPGETRPVYTQLSVSPHLDSARPIRDRFLIIATEEPADFHPLVQSTLLRSAPEPPIAVPAMIENALCGRVTRGAAILLDEGPRFGIRAVDVLVDLAGEAGLADELE